MDITIKQVEHVAIVAITGEIDANSAPEVQEKILPLIAPDCRLLLDLSKVEYMSSAGLRILLAAYRRASEGGRIVLVGVAEGIQDTMEVTGFIKFFTVCQTVAEGMQVLSA